MVASPRKPAVDEKGDMVPNFTAQAPKTAHVPITMPNFRTAEFLLRGTTPLVLHKFSHKTLLQIMAKQREGTKSARKTVHAARDFDDDYYQARHISTDGWDGIAAPAFRNAMIESCKLCGFKMSVAKMTIFVEPDGLDSTEGTPLVRIISPDGPRMLTSMVRIGTVQKVADVSVRPQWLEWGVRLRVTFDADQFTLQDVTALVVRAGMQNGVGEGRPNSKESCGQGWGTWRIVKDDDPLFRAEPPKGSRAEVARARRAGARLEAEKAALGNPDVLKTATERRRRRQQ